ncbi:MAG: ABC transporter permease [Firmicutes bacterium]|nr:ABC transporter permease [Bacillota bacterium]
MLTKLPFKNLVNRPARSAALIIISAFLSFSVFGGAMVLSSLQIGLGSLRSRLGADIIAVPDKAARQNDLEAILIQGRPGYFYMDKENLDKISCIEGIEAVSAQYYLASLSAGCCSMPVQVIGFDPETDFSVKPWIQKSYKKQLNEGDVLAGANINAEAGENLRFYGETCKVAAKLDKTGTELDNAVYADSATVKMLMAAAKKKGVGVLEKNDPEKLISSVLIKVKDGYDVSKVSDEINIHLRGVTAVKTQNMISGIAQSLSGISEITNILMWAIRALALVIMAVAFSMMINERKREFAVLRVIGASRKRLAGIVLTESVIVGCMGGLTGVLAACVLIFPFGGLLEQKIGLPYLVPDVKTILLTAVSAVLAAMIAGPLTAAFSAVKIGRMDTGVILNSN